MSVDLVLEIGTEDLPSALAAPAADELRREGARLLDEARIGHGEAVAFATHRRLALFVRDVEEVQEDLVLRTKGPAKNVAFDEDGSPTKAAAGFARSQGVPVEELECEETDGGVYVFATRVERGRSTAAVLEEALGRLVEGLTLQKPMRWGRGESRFIRPVRWLLCLLGDRVVPFSAAGVRAGRATRGHRFLDGEVALKDASTYVDALRAAHVIVDPEERLARLRDDVARAAASAGGRVDPDDPLFDTILYWCEFPTAFEGSFPQAGLDLPEAVLKSAMRGKQRLFPVFDDGRLLPKFVGVRDGGEDGLDDVRKGNERVLEAMIADARFFFKEDLEVGLPERVEQLRKVLFQERLGSLYDKVQRVRRLSRIIAECTEVGEDISERVDRAALLCKADLATEMVRELPDLEGAMGREYALRSGEEEVVAQGIFEHYLPRHAADDLPQTMVGTIVGLADRLDTIAGYLAVGIRPSGSQDPYGLRRMAQGVVAVLEASELPLSLDRLADHAVNGLSQCAIDEQGRASAADEAKELLRARVRALLASRGARHDVADAVLAAGWGHVPSTLERARALGRLVESPPDLDDVMTVFRRAHRLSSGVEAGDAKRELLVEAAEKYLYQETRSARADADACIGRGDYDAFFKVVASLRPAVDRFFDEVLVMTDDEAVRENRLALLREVSSIVLRAADLSRLAVER